VARSLLWNEEDFSSGCLRIVTSLWLEREYLLIERSNKQVYSACIYVFRMFVTINDHYLCIHHMFIAEADCAVFEVVSGVLYDSFHYERAKF